MYRYSLEERVFIVKTYGITGSIKNFQRRFVEQFGGRNPPLKHCIQLLVAGCVAVSFRVDYLYLIFSCCQLPFCEFPKHTTALHYRYDIQMYCTCSFCKPTFSGATREWHALYNGQQKIILVCTFGEVTTIKAINISVDNAA
jgi:hypothetical protein